MFAIITPALITGAFVNRVTFKSYLIFLVLWQLLVYYPFAHMVWGGGLLAKWGVLDFAGGIVVHAIAGFAALASVIYVGKRRDKESPPNSVPLIAIGTGLLWFGWYGFNAGSALDVNAITGLGIFKYRCCCIFCCDHLVSDRMVFSKETKICWIAYRCCCRISNHHTGCRICFTSFGLYNRNSCRDGLLYCRSFEK